MYENLMEEVVSPENYGKALKAVIAGVGSVRARLAGVLSQHGVKRPMIVCGSNLAQSPLLDIVGTATECDVFVYDG